MGRIRTRYSLYYSLPEAKPAATRSIRVELTAAQRSPESRVRTRSGYVVPYPAKSAPGSRYGLFANRDRAVARRVSLDRRAS